VLIGQTDLFPYGEVWSETGTQTKYKFSGKERDAESGNDYFGERYLDNTAGRFLTVDPVIHLNDPQSFNAYVYTLNDPVNLIDPDGADSFKFENGALVGDNAWAFGVAMYNTPKNNYEIWQMALSMGMELPYVDGFSGPQRDILLDNPFYLKYDRCQSNPACNGQNALAIIAALKATSAQNLDSSENAAKSSAQKAGAVSSTKASGVWINAYGGTAAQRTAELAAISEVLTHSERGKAMLKALEDRKSGLFGLWGSPKSFDIIQIASGGSYAYAGGQAIMLDYHDVGAAYTSARGGGTYSLQRIFAHEFPLCHAAMGNLDNGSGQMNNVNWNENPVMLQLGDFNNRIAY
jgi:RHS repeat-associated protein